MSGCLLPRGNRALVCHLAPTIFGFGGVSDFRRVLLLADGWQGSVPLMWNRYEAY